MTNAKNAEGNTVKRSSAVEQQWKCARNAGECEREAVDHKRDTRGSGLAVLRRVWTIVGGEAQETRRNGPKRAECEGERN
jgi:hypothetical protein